MVHIVNDLGADPNGGDITSILESSVGNGTVVEFPSDGTFRISGGTINADNFELRGNGATLINAPGWGLITLNGKGWLMDGFEIDMTRNNANAQMMTKGGGYAVTRCIWRGAQTEGSYKLVGAKYDHDGATFESCYFPDGATDPGVPGGVGALGSFGDWQNDGEIALRGCYFHGFAGTTVYLSETDGNVLMEDCFFWNTMNGPRVYGGTLRRVTSVCDGPIPIKEGHGAFQAGVWINGDKGDIIGLPPRDTLIEDCDFYMDSQYAASPVKSTPMSGNTTIRNTRIHNGTGGDAIEMTGGYNIDLENVQISGNDSLSLSGNVIRQAVQSVSGIAANADPRIPQPPASGVVDVYDGRTIGGGGGGGGGGQQASGGGALAVGLLGALAYGYAKSQGRF